MDFDKNSNVTCGEYEQVASDLATEHTQVKWLPFLAVGR